MPEKYDIIHHFGLFYHLRDPLLSLAQCRKMLTEDGTLLLETAFINDNVNSYMQFSGLPGKYHFYGATDTWAPTKRCLKEILIRSFLQPVEEKKWQYVKPPLLTIQKRVGRISLMAKPLPESEGTTSDRNKVFGCQ
jgi:hypothetical protein